MHFSGDFDSLLADIDDIDLSLDRSLVKIKQQVKSMENSVLPVYENTRQLQQLQTNINNTNSELDKILSYYKILEKASKLGDQTPEEVGIETYIDLCFKIRESKDYFNLTKKCQSEVVTCAELLATARVKIENQLTEYLAELATPKTPTLEDTSIPNLDSQADLKRAQEIYHGIYLIIEYMSKIKSRFFVSAIADYRGEKTHIIVDQLDAKLDRLEDILDSKDYSLNSGSKTLGGNSSGGPTLKRSNSFSKAIKTGLTKSKSSLSLLSHSASRRLHVGGTPKKTQHDQADAGQSSGTPQRPATSHTTPVKRKKYDTLRPKNYNTERANSAAISRAFVNEIVNALEDFEKLVEFLPKILQDETEFIMQIITVKEYERFTTSMPESPIALDRYRAVKNSYRAPINFYSSHLKGDLLSAIIEARLYTTLHHAKKLLIAALKIASKAPDFIQKTLVATLKFLNCYKENYSRISHGVSLTSDVIRSEVSSLGREFEEVVYQIGNNWMEMFRLHESKSISLDTHRHGLTDICFTTLKGCLKYADMCGILIDDEMIIKNYDNRKRFSEFSKRGIGALKLCLEQKALLKFPDQPYSQSLFLFNNYSYMLRYLRKNNDLTDVIQINFPEILEVIDEDRRRTFEAYMSLWNEELFHLKLVPSKLNASTYFTKKLLKKCVTKLEKISKSQASLKITDEGDRSEIIERLDENLEDLFQNFDNFDFYEKVLPSGYYSFVEMLFSESAL